MRTTIFLFILTLTTAAKADWVTKPSYFTHQNGVRVPQYAPLPEVYVAQGARKSGYHHTTSVLAVDGRIDAYHQLNEWGAPMKPYEHWLQPFAPYHVPVWEWQNPPPQVYAPTTITTQPPSRP